MSDPGHETLLIEVGVEEIPSRFVGQLGRDFLAGIEDALTRHRLAHRNAEVRYTPRRLVFDAEVALQQEPLVETVRGPASAVAWKDGQPTPALKGFLGRVGLAESELGRQMVGDREYVTARVSQPVASAADTIAALLDEVLIHLPQPRSMRWGSDDTRFVRPIRWLLVILGSQPLSGRSMGVSFGTVTYGNRTDHPAAIAVHDALEYRSAMERGLVALDAAERSQVIVQTAEQLAHECGGVVDIDNDLLEEVTNLVEWPTPFVGSFDPAFLGIPESILVTSMRVHQRYFPVRAADGKLLPFFVAVRNGIGEELDLVRRGNEKVLRARLSDARYFFEHDRTRRLESYVPRLGEVTVHAKLGTYQDKIDRLQALFSRTSSWWPLDAKGQSSLKRAILLYKCDLLTQVVGEFPELQGEMGAVYAELDGEGNFVVEAIRDQYHPSSGKDRLPVSNPALVLGLLERIDTLMAFYHAQIRATGSEDPFGLRRAALGVARLASETAILGSHTVAELVAEAGAVVGADESVGAEVMALVASRLQSQWEDHWPKEQLAAVLAREFPWSWLGNRLAFLSSHLAEAEDVAAAYKRVGRIVRDSSDQPASTLYEGIESSLADAVGIADSVETGQLEEWWAAAKHLGPLVNQFFDEVLVMDPDEAVRHRRLHLLRRVQAALGRYFDWEQI